MFHSVQGPGKFKIMEAASDEDLPDSISMTEAWKGKRTVQREREKEGVEFAFFFSTGS